jgi:ATP-binding cassette subfamily F protein 2
MGRRYGLLGRNGSGKTTFLKSLAAREFPIPAHIDIYLLQEQAEPSDMKPIEGILIIYFYVIVLQPYFFF